MTKPVEDIHTSVVARPPTDRVVYVEPTIKRVRAMFGGETVADSQRTLILFEKGHLPVYYFPLENVRQVGGALWPCRSSAGSPRGTWSGSAQRLPPRSESTAASARALP